MNTTNNRDLVENLYGLFVLAVQNKLIPKENFNSDDLMAIAQYLTDGEIPMRTSATGSKEVNTELLNIAKKIWELGEKERLKKELAKALEEKERAAKAPTDKTGVKSTPAPQQVRH